MKDKIFGDIEYSYIWSRDLTLPYMTEEKTIPLMIEGESDGIFEEEQYNAYISLMNNWTHIQQGIIEEILSYYIKTRIELGYDIDPNFNYPDINTVEDLLNHIELDGIHIPYAFYDDKRSVGLLFNCTWDSENGIGVELINEQVHSIGFQDNVL